MTNGINRLLTNMLIRTKLLILIAIPFSLAVVFGGFYTLNSYQIQQDMSRITSLVDLGTEISALVHESQKERGMTAGYIGSKGAKFSDKLPAQRKLFDEKHAILAKSLAEIDTSLLDVELKQRIEAAVSHLANTESIRKQVTALNIPLPKALGHYTKLNALMLGNIEYLTHLSRDAEVSERIVAFTSFLQSKERAGIERAVLTNTFAGDKFAPNFYQKFVSLVAAQDSYMHSFKVNATKTNLAFFEEQMKTPAVAEVASMRAIAHKHANTGGFGIDAGHWFATITKKINSLKAVENKLAESILNSTTSLAEEKQLSFILSAFFLILGMLLVILLSVLILKNIRVSVNFIKSTMYEIESTGDLSLQAPIVGSDEFSDIAAAYNRFTENLQRVIAESNSVLANVANGDFSSRMKLGSQGDLEQLKNGVNGSAKSVQFMIDELSKVMRSLSAGKFDVKMDEHVPESFRDQIDSSLSIIANAVNEINSVMNEMADGKFSSRLEADVPGDLDVMKQSVNSALGLLEKGIMEVNGVLNAQASGDLKHRIHGQYKGVLDELKVATNNSIEQTQNAIAQVKITSSTVHKSSQEIASGSDSLSSRVQQQAAALEQTASAMEQITATIQQSTSLSVEASKLSEEATVSSQEGAEVMKKTVTAMERINDVSININEIISLIDNIAFQTNLLALNAAVEAARAGEHGRGFAVVAGEVRNLAGRSADAAKDIKQLIERTNVEVASGTELVKSSGEALETINGQIEKISSMVTEMATGSKQQAQGVEQVNLAITSLDQNTQENAALVEETSSASANMADEATELDRIVSKFKI